MYDAIAGTRMVVSWHEREKKTTTSVIVLVPVTTNGAVKPSSMHWNWGFSHGSEHPRNIVAIRAEVQHS